MTETIQIEIPAPPEGWVYDGFRHPIKGEWYYYDNKWHEAECDYPLYLVYPCAILVRFLRAIRKQEPKELVRFHMDTRKSDMHTVYDGMVYAFDDLGGIWVSALAWARDGEWLFADNQDEQPEDGDELHPRLTIRSDGDPIQQSGAPVVDNPPPVEGYGCAKLREENQRLREDLKHAENEIRQLLQELEGE